MARGQEDDRDFRLEIETAAAIETFAHLKGRIDRDDALIRRWFFEFSLGHQDRNHPAHSFAFDDDSIGSAEAADDFGAKSVDIGDGVSENQSVAPITGGCDEPTVLFERLKRRISRNEFSLERGTFWTLAVRENQHALIPVRRFDPGVFRAGEFALLDFESRGGRACDGYTEKEKPIRYTHDLITKDFRPAVHLCSDLGMSLQKWVKASVLSQPIYEPGKPIEEVARELGLDPAGIIKIASNENPFGPSPRALDAAIKALKQSALYPDGGCFELRQRLAQHVKLKPEQITVGNGSNEIIELLGHVFLGPGDDVVMGNPAFAIYKLVTLLFGARAIEVPLLKHRHDLGHLLAAITPRTKLVFLPSPNNPTGTANTEEEIFTFVRALPEHVVFVYDEAYAEFVENPPDLRPLIAEGRQVICLRTFSKIYGLASLRVGYGYSSAELAGWLNRVRQPFNVNAIGQAAAIAALDDDEFAQRYARENRAGLGQLEAGFKRLWLEYVPSVANFIMVNVGDGGADAPICVAWKHSRVEKYDPPNAPAFGRGGPSLEVRDGHRGRRPARYPATLHSHGAQMVSAGTAVALLALRLRTGGPQQGPGLPYSPDQLPHAVQPPPGCGTRPLPLNDLLSG